MECGSARLFVRLLGALQAFLFDVHVGELVRVEDLAAFQAFYKFGIFFAGEYAHAWVFAGFHSCLFRCGECPPIAPVSRKCRLFVKRKLTDLREFTSN